MITDAILAILFAVLEFLVTLFPGYTAPSTVCSACEQFGGFLAAADDWVDLGAFGSAIGVVLGAFGLVGVIKLAMWIYEKLPFKFT